MNNSNSNHDRYFHLFIQGDERGFTYIYDNMYRNVFYHASRILQNDAEVKSIVNDVFLLAWRQRQRMESFIHVLMFVRLRSRWRCFNYLKSNAGKFSRDIFPLEFHENAF